MVPAAATAGTPGPGKQESPTQMSLSTGVATLGRPFPVFPSATHPRPP